MSENGRHKACNACRERKIKCDGGQPKCGRCTRCGVQCFYAPPSKRYSKADFASVLEALNHRMLQAEAVVATAAQSGVRPLLPSASPAISSMWSQFAPISNSPESPFVGMDFIGGNNLFPANRDFSLPDLSPGEVDSRGNFMFPTNDAAGKTNSLSNASILTPEMSPPITSNKEFDYNVGDYTQAKALHTPNNRATGSNQTISGQPLPSSGSSWMGMFSEGPASHGRRESTNGQVSDLSDGNTTRGASREFVDLDNDFVSPETAPSANFSGMAKDNFSTAINSNWKNNTRLGQGSSENENGFSERSSETRSLRGEENQNPARTPQQAHSTLESTRAPSSYGYSPRYPINELPEVSDAFEYENQYAISGSASAPLKRRRLGRDTIEQQSDNSMKVRGQRDFELDHEGSRAPAGSQQRPSSQNSVNSGQSLQSRIDASAHARLERRSSGETYFPSPKTSKPPSPCSSSMRRNIGTGTAFNGIVKLRGAENYPEWARAIRAAARKEGVWDMMTGQCISPEPLFPNASLAEQREYQDNVVYWTNKTELALGGIEGSLEDHIQASVDNIECPRTMWLKLERAYKTGENKALYTLIQKMDNISLKSCGNVEKLGNELRQVQEGIELLKKSENLPDWYFAIRFLHSLGPAYEEFITKVLMDAYKDQEKDFNFEQIVSQAIIEEQRNR